MRIPRRIAVWNRRNPIAAFSVIVPAARGRDFVRAFKQTHEKGKPNRLDEYKLTDLTVEVSQGYGQVEAV